MTSAVLTDPRFKVVNGGLENSNAEYAYDIVLSDGEEKVLSAVLRD